MSICCRKLLLVCVCVIVQLHFIFRHKHPLKGTFEACSLSSFLPFGDIICPIAIAYSMGQIMKSVCVCQSVYVSVCPSASTLTVAFLDRFSPKLVQT